MEWPQSCGSYPALVGAPPAVLSTSLAARFPNGADVSLEVTLDKAGRVVRVTSNAAAALDTTVAAWAKSATYTHPGAICPEAPGQTTVRFDETFLAAASGVVGIPGTVSGVSFDDVDRKYRPGSCDDSNSDDHTTFEVQRVFAGHVAGVPVALVVLRCEYTPSGFNAADVLFAVDGGRARQLGVLGTTDCFATGCAIPSGEWIYTNFHDGRLYADVWDEAKKCNPKADWVSTIYTIAAGKLKALSVTRHHRAGVTPTCTESYI
jgi:hypothetical protein